MSAEEDARIELWNLQCFERQGFDAAQRATLRAWRIDPHNTEPLVNAGCPYDLVLRILQPDDDYVVLTAESELSVV
jgi:hypothetical protein